MIMQLRLFENPHFNPVSRLGDLNINHYVNYHCAACLQSDLDKATTVTIDQQLNDYFYLLTCYPLLQFES